MQRAPDAAHVSHPLALPFFISSVFSLPSSLPPPHDPLLIRRMQAPKKAIINRTNQHALDAAYVSHPLFIILSSVSSHLVFDSSLFHISAISHPPPITYVSHSR